MAWQFEKWLDVEFHHDFFLKSDGSSEWPGSELAVEPTSACARLIADRQLLFRATPRGFSVLYRALADAAGNPHPVIPLQDDFKLIFHLHAADPLLPNYSDLPLAGGNGVFLLNNLADNRQALSPSASAEWLLSRDTSTPYLTGADHLVLRGPVFPYRFDSPAAGAQLQIRDALGHIHRQETLIRKDGGFEFLVDLSGREEGVYSIWIDGAQREVFYCGAEAKRKRPFAIVEIHQNAAVPPTYKLVDGAGDAVPRTYTARIKNRRTAWKYYVGLKYRKDIPPAELSIVSPDPSVAFAPGPVETRLGGVKTVSFDTGSGLLPLRQEPLKGFRLVKTGGTPGTLEVQNLPNPPAANIKVDGGRIVSEVFVYV